MERGGKEIYRQHNNNNNNSSEYYYDSLGDKPCPSVFHADTSYYLTLCIITLGGEYYYYPPFYRQEN